MLRLICLLLLSISLLACSTSKRSPKFYPNDKLAQTESEVLKKDTQYCQDLGEDYVKDPEKWKGVAKGTAKSSVIGATGGAVGGAILSNAGRGTAVGAATGAIVGLIHALERSGEPNPTYEKFVEQCLADKGYRIYSWG